MDEDDLERRLAALKEFNVKKPKQLSEADLMNRLEAFNEKNQKSTRSDISHHELDSRTQQLYSAPQIDEQAIERRLNALLCPETTPEIVQVSNLLREQQETVPASHGDELLELINEAKRGVGDAQQITEVLQNDLVPLKESSDARTLQDEYKALMRESAACKDVQEGTSDEDSEDEDVKRILADAQAQLALSVSEVNTTNRNQPARPRKAETMSQSDSEKESDDAISDENSEDSEDERHDVNSAIERKKSSRKSRASGTSKSKNKECYIM
eukprot:GILJ01003536.1.p1 GENE.GILJ01003536.1~~GILJ01003536.1.p1  ORF type:complete len:270 (+),score=43.75 GILJ01003536.1:212-1021(+)